MMRNLSLKTKTLVLLAGVVMLCTLPLGLYYYGTVSALAKLGDDPSIGRAVDLAAKKAVTQEERETAVAAFRMHGQVQVLRTSIIRQVLLFTVIYFVVVAGIALLLGWYFISRITQPLRELTRATETMSAGNLDVRLSLDTGGEIGLLLSSFNRMASDLKTAREQQAMAERRATWQQVARTIAHEIKNPLTPIKLSTERLWDKFQNNAKDLPKVMESTTTTILTEIDNLQKLVDAFHQYAKFPDPVLRPDSLNTLVRETVDLYQGGNVPVLLELSKTDLPMPLDRGQLRQALNNLIKNGIEAVEIAGRTGQVLVKTQISDKALTLSVSDTGCGISEEDISRLFQPYFTTKKQGNGIGLALTERIVTLHNGRIRCTSVKDKGSTFTMTFNVKPSEA